VDDNEQEINEEFDRMFGNVIGKLNKIGSHMVGEFRAAIGSVQLSEEPHRTGAMVNGIHYGMKIESPQKGSVIITIPFPWQFFEYGFQHVGGKYIPARPVGRRTWNANTGVISDIVNGQE
jgi:hypothetical protein